MNIPTKIKTWQEMTPEEQAEDHKKPYNHWTVRRMLEANERTTTDRQGWGMTVADLVQQLVAYPPHTEVLIRDRIGWSGVSNYEIEIKEALILADQSDDYDAQRKELLAGEVRGKRVVALVKSGYEAETVDPYDAKEYQEEE